MEWQLPTGTGMCSDETGLLRLQATLAMIGRLPIIKKVNVNECDSLGGRPCKGAEQEKLVEKLVTVGRSPQLAKEPEMNDCDL